MRASPTAWIGYVGFGYTDSEITEAPAGSTGIVGNQAPLVSKNTLNLGTQYRQPLGNGLSAVFRADFQRIGRTWWDPDNSTSRDPVEPAGRAPGRRGRAAGRSRPGRRT